MTARDRIRVTGLDALGRHGVYPSERQKPQRFVVDLCLDLAASARDDDLATTVDYSAISAEVVDIITGEPVNLIETLAERIAAACLKHAGVATAGVTVHKPEAPMGCTFTDVSVTISRSNP